LLQYQVCQHEGGHGFYYRDGAGGNANVVPPVDYQVDTIAAADSRLLVKASLLRLCD
jgi:hypothetical protein